MLPPATGNVRTWLLPLRMDVSGPSGVPAARLRVPALAGMLTVAWNWAEYGAAPSRSETEMLPNVSGKSSGVVGDAGAFSVGASGAPRAMTRFNSGCPLTGSVV